MTEEGDKYISEIYIKQKHTIALPATFPTFCFQVNTVKAYLLFFY